MCSPSSPVGSAYGRFERFVDRTSQLLETLELTLAQVEHLAVCLVRGGVAPALAHLGAVLALVLLHEVALHALELRLIVHGDSLLNVLDCAFDGANEDIESLSFGPERSKVTRERSPALLFRCAQGAWNLRHAHSHVAQEQDFLQAVEVRRGVAAISVGCSRGYEQSRLFVISERSG